MTLHTVLRLNAASCLAFGILFSTTPATMSSFLNPGQPAPQILFIITGWILIMNGIHLVWTSKQANPNRLMILYFSLGDILWVLVTLGLIISQQVITSNGGIMASITVAIFVGLMGWLQLKKGRKLVNT